MVLGEELSPLPELRQEGHGEAGGVIATSHPNWANGSSFAEGAAELLFTENETNTERLFGSPNRTPYVKDGINNYIVHGRQDALNPGEEGDQGVGALSADGWGRGIQSASPAAQ